MSLANMTVMDREHAARLSSIAIRKLTVDFTDGAEQSSRRTDSSTGKEDISNEELKPAPTRDDLSTARFIALMALHRLLSARGVSHADSDMICPGWVPNSDSHLQENSLGDLAGVHRDILHECISRLEESSNENANLTIDLMLALGTLLTKAGDFEGARKMYHRASAKRNPDFCRCLELPRQGTHAPAFGSYIFPGAGSRSRHHRLHFAFRENTPQLRPLTRTWIHELRSGLPDAPWRPLPFPPSALMDEMDSSLVVRSKMPAGNSESPEDEISNRACRIEVLPRAVQETTLLRKGTNLLEKGYTLA